LSVGDFQIEDEFVIGPAIDEAAELANAAEGAFCWMTPGTCAQFDAIYHEWQEFARQTPGCPSQEYVETLAPRYKIPLKNGGFCESRVVNPLAACRPEHREKFVKELLNTFVPLDNGAVMRKHENTQQFLRFAVTLPADPAMFQRL